MNFGQLNLDEIDRFDSNYLLQVSQWQFDLQADLSSTESDCVAKQSGFVDKSWERFAHANGGATAVNVTSKRQKVFGFDHFD